jgi:hypothetical protein
MKETVRYTEASRSDIERARALVFLDGVQKALQNNEHVFDLTLELEVVSSKFGGNLSWYVIAKNRDGEEVTSQDADNKGQHGEHVHPWNGTGEPEVVASSLKVARHWFNKKKAMFGDGHRRGY